MSLHVKPDILSLEYMQDTISVKFFFKLQVHPESVFSYIIVGEAQEDPTPNMKQIQSLTHSNSKQ